MTRYTVEANGIDLEIDVNLIVTAEKGTGERKYEGQYASLHERPGPKMRVAGNGITIQTYGSIKVQSQFEFGLKIGLVQCVTGHNLFATYGVSKLSRVRVVKIRGLHGIEWVN